MENSSKTYTNILYILFFLINISTYSQNFKKKSIYLVCRGTLSKKELIGEKFNMSNKNITHIGIGLFINNQMKIYNVSDNKIIDNSALICETLDEFLKLNDIYYLGIWEYKTNKKMIKEIQDNISILKNVKFDKQFQISKDNNLYCSEFVASILNSIGDFNYKPIIKELNGVEKDILGSDSFEYYPVDFFLQNKKFTQKKIIFY